MATTYKTSLNSNLQLQVVSNDDTQTKVLAVNGSNNIIYRNSSTLTPANQSLNTNSNVTFNKVTANTITALPAPVVPIPFISNNLLVYSIGLTTTTATATTILSYSTVTNKNYTIFAELSMMDGASGTAAGASAFIQTKRVTNVNGVLDIGTVESFMSRQGNTTTANLQFVASGSLLNIQVIGIASNTNYWTLFVRIIST
jgi:hypothetical protein